MLSPLRLITVFAPGDPLAPQLAPFSDALIDSAWFREVTADYGIAPPESSAQVTGAPLAAGSVLDESQLLAYVAAVAAGPSLAPDGRTLYLVYLPEAVTVTLSGQGVSCKNFYGFHDWAAAGAGAATYGIAIVPRCSSYLDDLTYPASHEVIEAVTDNGNGTGWYLDPADGSTGGPPEEIGDLCSGTATLEDKWLYTRVYSNLAAANGGDPCVPADAEPFFATSTPQAHYREGPVKRWRFR